MSHEPRLIGITKSARYAILGLVHLASQPPGQLVLAEATAQRLKLPKSFLAKLFQRLAHKGILVSQRGPRGGYALARAASTITLAEVVDATQEPRPGERDCMLEPRRCGVGGPCAMHDHLMAAERRVRDALSSLSLAQAARGEGVLERVA
ncbi:MAG: Rrf2 family transcriptional regulator [Elusimicrobia bacterium]|nr:Rrf2 family transcriptional regulator [Elusimicrobiota bacterium]